MTPRPPAPPLTPDAVTRRRRLVLLATAFPALGVALALGAAAAAVRHAHDRLLLDEAAMAVELLRLSASPGVVAAAFDGRTRLSDQVDSTLDEPELASRGGQRVARATVYDRDEWFARGTLEIRQAAGRSATLRASVWAAATLCLLALALVAVRWAVHPGGGRAALPLIAASLAVVVPFLLAARWAMQELEHATASRSAEATRLLRTAPRIEDVLDRPGGVYALTRLSFIIRDAGGRVVASSLSPEVSAVLGAIQAPAPPRVTVDHMTYAVSDVGSVRLVGIPYEHTGDPRPLMAGILGIALAAGLLPASLVPLAHRGRAFRADVTAWSFLAPSCLHLAVFTVGPLGFAAWLSLHRWSLLDVARPFVGLDNYHRALADSGFWNALRNTAVFTLHVPVAMTLALFFALMLRQASRRTVVLRTLVFLPSITSLVAIAMVWQWMLNDRVGLVNWLVSAVGLAPVHWLTSPRTALLSLMLLTVWMVIGYQMVVFQAGLAAIPTEQYDAARIDGAGRIARFLHVTLPGLRHTLFFVLITSVIASFQVFGAVYVMTEGGPLHATDVAVFHIYEEAWEFMRFGDASAQSWILFAVIFLITWLHFRAVERRAAA